LRAQIAALGTGPNIEGQLEAPEIAARRLALSDQLTRLLAPGLAAEEAYRRSDGLIKEVDRVLRERQTDALLRLWPSPINPSHWPTAASALTQFTLSLVSEIRSNLARAGIFLRLGDNLPLIFVYVIAALALWLRGHHYLEKIAPRLMQIGGTRAHHLWKLIFSTSQVIFPTFGVYLLCLATLESGILGVNGVVIVNSLPVFAVTMTVAIWLGNMMFPQDFTRPSAVNIPTERYVSGRVYAQLLGLLLGLDYLRAAIFTSSIYDDAAVSVLMFPSLAMTGLVILRMGLLLRRPNTNQLSAPQNPNENQNSWSRLLAVLARSLIVIGYLGPILGAIGYVSAGAALVFPAALTLGLVGGLLVLQNFVSTFYAFVMHRSDDEPEPLLPVLIGFGLTLMSLPLLALIWGARLADIQELWMRFMDGVPLGDARISPMNFVSFAVLFGVGYLATRLVQGALRSSILPKTNLDQGGRNAVVAGVGYMGIFFAALIAINAVGIDLSGLAIVAGALSVGIGFGLQNIVSNFVSGIILLIERPVSEGDWIEVGGVHGTVRSISVRSTRIETFDRSDVIVPNADLVSGQVTNWTRFSAMGRLIVPIAVAHQNDPELVKKILYDIGKDQPLSHKDPEPAVILCGFSVEAMNFELRMVLRDVNEYVNVRSDVNFLILTKFKEAGITLPALGIETLVRAAQLQLGATGTLVSSSRAGLSDD
jgi:potassium efflux system protein